MKTGRLLAALLLTLIASSMLISATPQNDLTELKNLLSEEAFVKHIMFLSSLESKMTGYEGFYEAAKYIERTLRSYGLEVRVEKFNVTVPVVEYSYILVRENKSLVKIKAYPLWPNHVCTCSYDSSADGDTLVRISSLSDLKKVDIRGKFVLLDYNTRFLWKILCILGAKGVVFIEPIDTSYSEGMLKSLNVPLYFPRLYVSYSDGLQLMKIIKRDGYAKIWVYCKVEWKNVEAYNIVGVIEGTDPLYRGEVMVLASHYDSWSPVLGKAPGATDSLGIAFLLEYARALTIVKPRRTVWIVALAGHYQYLWGAREFVERHFDEIGVYIKGFASIDLSSDSDILGLYALGLGYGYINPESLVNQKYSWVSTRFFGEWLSEAKSLWKEDFRVADLITFSYPPWIKLAKPVDPPYLYLDSEPFTAATFGGGIAFVTTNTLRLYQQTPLDTFDRLNLRNFFKQAKYLWTVLYRYVNMEIPYALTPTRLYGDWGYVTLSVQLAEYNVETAWYNNFSDPRAVICISATNTPSNAKWAAKGFLLVVKPDSRGLAVVKGLKPFSTVDVQGYVLDNHGKVLYATDTGVYGLPRTLVLTVSRAYKLVPVFKTATIILLQPLDPQTLQINFKAVDVLNFLSHTPLIHRDNIAPPPSTLMTKTYTPTALQDIAAFVEPNVPVEIVVRTDDPYPLIVLNNASPENLAGNGFILREGEEYIASPLDYARDMYFLAVSRAKILVEKSAVSARLCEYYSLMEETAKKSFAENPTQQYACSFSLWAYSRGVYTAAMSQMNDIVLTTLFFMFFSALFAISFERLVFMSEGVKRVLLTVTTYLVTIGVLSIFHPGFHVTINVYVLAISASIGILVLVLVAMLLGETYSQMKKFREYTIGKHFIEVERLSLLVTAFSTGARNLRKRKLRTVLTLISIICSVLALTAFTSVTSGILINVIKVGKAPYEGILIERAPWMINQPIPEEFIVEMELLLGDNFTVAPRSWIYPPGYQFICEWNASPHASIKGAVAISPALFKVLELENLPPQVVAFQEDEEYCCVISAKTAEALSESLGRKVGLGSRINLWGLDLTVKGIIEGKYFWSGSSGVVDLDQQPITPIDIEQGLSEVSRRLSGSDVVIIPVSLALKAFNAQPLAVSIIPKEKLSDAELNKLAQAMAKRFLVDIYVGLPEEKTALRIAPRVQVVVGGLSTVIVPLLIVGFTVLLTMLNSIYERVREVKVYSAVGLAPVHVMGMFLAEALIFSIVGSVIGYVVGMAGVSFLWSIKAYPPNFYPNYASAAVILVVVVTVFFTLLSAAYPAYKASTLITPSFERKWKIETKPRDNVWSLPLPFRANEKEVYGVLEFVREYLEAHSVERMGLFFVEGDFKYYEREEGGRPVKVLETKVRLAPFDQGIVQKTIIVATKVGATYGFEVVAVKETGPEIPWISSNTAFFRELRKQFLAWRFLSDKSKREYIERGLSRFKGGEL
ncbi:MAG: hypothetical protein DRN04_07785 [Thermoprotei archaeon]|nr:MAG: hypothetical protein DRN04_07785 [Thermoprotei archaeon]